MPKNHTHQPLSELEGDVSSLIGEMKRRAGVATDSELAAFVGISQSAVANWRRRGAIPEAAIFRFERALAHGGNDAPQREFYARAVVIRLADFWFDKVLATNSHAKREIIYFPIAVAFPMIVTEVSQQMLRLERERQMTSQELAVLLLSDEQFLDGLLAWVKGISFSDMLAAAGRA